MKKMFLSMAAAFFLFVLCGPSAAQTPSKPLKIIEKEEGKVESVTRADPNKGSLGAMTIVSQGGKKMDFQFLPRTRLYNADSGPLTLEQLKKGDQVVILYVISLKGMNDAISVTKSK